MSEKPPLTPEQIAEYVANRKRRITQFKEDIPLLKIEAEYMGLLASIDESTLRRATAQSRFAQLMTPEVPGEKTTNSTATTE
jgi:hypothetical protein